jgi:cyclomaltodextrinase / maltogenic alpha-amylase / neopullulanase
MLGEQYANLEYMSTLQLGRYRHFKGAEYRVIGVAKHTETLEDMVVYEALYEHDLGKLWVRPLSMFLESVEIDGKTVSRFTFIEAYA